MDERQLGLQAVYFTPMNPLYFFGSKLVQQDSPPGDLTMYCVSATSFFALKFLHLVSDEVQHLFSTCGPLGI